MANITLSQAERIATLSTPLGEDRLLLDRVVVREQLSQPFQIEADLLGESAAVQGDVKFEDLIGQSVTISLRTRNGEPRFFNGIVRRFSQVATRSRYSAYRAEIVPVLWTYSCNSQCRIFQNLTVPEIIREVLDGLSLEMTLSGSYEPRVYCVQYRESDLNFVHRLMEEEGIYYFFRHSEGDHSMVITDSTAAHEPLLGEYQEMPFRPYTGHPTGDEFIYDWAIEKTLLPVTFTHTDYDFEMPRKSLMVRSQRWPEHAHARGEIYDFPGRHTSHQVGDQRARVRIEEIQAGYEIARGKADARGIQSGFKFSLSDHPRDDQNRDYLVTSAVHYIQLSLLESDSGMLDHAGSIDGDNGAPYLCEFSAIPASEPFRPRRVTPKPIVQGPQTAVVVGPTGEEIYTDEHARVKVQFHWDREGRLNENSSCWVRVSHAWAGRGWGQISLPRIGQEVIVDFLEGDPDHPIITGRVYNGDCAPPFPLPDKMMVSGVKSDSTPGGGGYNEISLDDTRGAEKIVVHGQYDMETTILHDDTKDVGHHETTTIGVDRSVTVGRNHSEAVGVDQSKTIGKSRALTVGIDETIQIGAKQSTTIGANRDLTVGGMRTTSIGATDSLTVGGAITISAGATISISAAGVITISSAGAMTISAGAALAITAGGAIALTAPAIALNGRPVAPIPAPI